jgi:hypothetical protein
LGEAANLARKLLRRLRHLRRQDAVFLLERRKVDPIVEAAPFERVVDFARPV